MKLIFALIALAAELLALWAYGAGAFGMSAVFWQARGACLAAILVFATI